VDTRYEVTDLLVAWRGGDGVAKEQLFAIVYEELRRIARRQLALERTGHTLRATALVHEAYLRLFDHTRAEWADRAQFFAVASQVMRRVLVDYARRHRAAKRDGALVRVTLDDADAAVAGADDRAETLLQLDEALLRLAAIDERRARIVDCRFFGGLTNAETGAALGVTERTVEREWAKAKQWLYEQLS